MSGGYKLRHLDNLRIIWEFLKEVNDLKLQGKLQGIIDALDDPLPPTKVKPVLALHFHFVVSLIRLLIIGMSIWSKPVKFCTKNLESIFTRHSDLREPKGRSSFQELATIFAPPN